ncbi:MULTISPECIES: hypothetical protein [Enterobacter]|uniref:hypothetical protein n=1 Tax=Enterobacter TaxID=547 RepID=UPI00049EE259|nr:MULTISPECIES: hypothetical protein [Enterobacter]GJJ92563.1 hypothetical protein TUM16654_08430 [Enterobacter cloacae]GJL09731.1 hypothetical protein TUM17571_40390 [Klebsiella pneumoniae]HCR2215689.1 hypothetical protein [Enterobacter hormaechei subsp. xiangfangensis]KDM55863.1 hypothetical protein AF34_00761 [Enterobacter hormaechei subsp. hoffmannii]MBA7812182.1 hypothetical protein [Enterobacter hormaechei]
MSLETSLELNNQLLTQHNALLERIITALASGVALRPDTVAQVQEYRETVPETKAENTVIRKVTLDDLEFSDIIALAAFYPEAQDLSETMVQRVVDYRDAEGDKRVVQIDALDSALQGVKRAGHLNKPALLDLSRNILRFWDVLPTIAARREFAERLLDAPADGRHEVKPKKADSKDEERTGPFYCKNVDGSAASELHTLRKLNELLKKGHVEITRVEYLQLQEDFARKNAAKGGTETGDDAGNITGDNAGEQTDFAALRKQAEGMILQLAKGGYRAEAVAILDKQGAKKLGEVADENLADVIAQAEKALEG